MCIRVHTQALFVREHFIAYVTIEFLFAVVHLYVDRFKGFVIVFATNWTVEFLADFLFTAGRSIRFHIACFIQCFRFDWQVHASVQSISNKLK